MHHFYRWSGLTWISLALLVMALSSCAPSKANKEYRMAALQGDVYRIAKSNKTTREAVKDLSGQLEALETKVDDLGGKVEGMTVTPKHKETGTADAGAISHRFGALEAKVEGLQKAVQELGSQDQSEGTSAGGKKKGATELQSEKTDTATQDKKDQKAEEHSAQLEYEKAYAAYTDRRFDDALNLFGDFLKRYPEHELADNAQYWLGETYYDMGDYGNAILTFKDVVTRYSDHAKAPDALLKIGYAYMALDDPSNARMFLKRLIKNYPSSAAEAKARTKLKELDNQ